MVAGGFQHLTLDERRSLFRLHEARPGIAAMAARLGRHRSTIPRDLRRNRFRDPDAPRDRRHDMSGYYPMTAQDLARARRERLYNYPVVNLPIFYTVVGMTRALDGLAADGHGAAITPEALAGTSPYLNEHLNRFGSYVLDLST